MHIESITRYTMAAPSCCSYCGSLESVDSSAFAPTCALCLSVSTLVDGGVAIYWHVSSKQYFQADGGVRSTLLKPGASAARIKRLKHAEGCPSITLDYHGVADAYTPSELRTALGAAASDSLILSYVKPCGEVRLRAQAALEAYSASGFDTWLSFLKAPVTEPLRAGTKGHFMATIGSRVLIDDSVEHTQSAQARGLGGLLVRSANREDVEAALVAARDGSAAWEAWQHRATHAAGSAVELGTRSDGVPQIRRGKASGHSHQAQNSGRGQGRGR